MKRLMIAVAFATLTTFGCASGPQSSGETQTAEAEMEHFKVMSWAEVEKAMGGGAVLVDARGTDGYAAGHIEGAINIPAKDETSFAALPADKETQLIFYCGGPQCKASTRAASKAKEMGYSQVAEYKGGYPEWKEMSGAEAPAEEVAPEEESAVN